MKAKNTNAGNNLVQRFSTTNPIMYNECNMDFESGISMLIKDENRKDEVDESEVVDELEYFLSLTLKSRLKYTNTNGAISDNNVTGSNSKV